MNTKRIFKKVAVSIGAATLVLAMSACASHSATAGTDYGQVRSRIRPAIRPSALRPLR